MIKSILIVFHFLSFTAVFAQSFAPPAGETGSTAIYKDSSVIVNSAINCIVTRGYMNIMDQPFGFASFGVDEDATGLPNSPEVISLGDGGEALLTFSTPIYNGLGPDFAVFENSFDGNFLELAFVEVSSNGVDFFRFPSVSETQTSVQVGSFENTDCRYVYNLAGKYQAGYGVPFDLEELNGISGLNVGAITHVKVIDVIGSVDTNFGSLDSQGNLINDPFPTAFPTGGFDLDGVGVINEMPLGLYNKSELTLSVYPNPVIDRFTIKSSFEGDYKLINSLGLIVRQGELINSTIVDLSDESRGMYILMVESSKGNVMTKIIRQ